MHGDYSGDTEIVVLCPTRENPKGAREMVASFYDTIERIDTEVILVVDDNDPAKAEYLSIPAEFKDRRVTQGIKTLRPSLVQVMVVEGGSLTKATNEAVVRVWDGDVILGHVGDDHVFITPGWDTAIRDVLLAEPGVAYARDGMPTFWASQWFTNAIIPRTLGWLALPGTKHLAIDDAFMDIGAGIGRLTLLPDVLIEHRNPVTGKNPKRAIVDSHYTKQNRAHENAVYSAWVAYEYEDDMRRLMDALGIEQPEEVPDAPNSAKQYRKQMYIMHEASYRPYVAPNRKQTVVDRRVDPITGEVTLVY